jgi:hypothetical protein
MDKPILRLVIHGRLVDGRLPQDRIPRTGAGSGNGETCDGCGEIVTQTQMIMEATGSGGTAVQFHVACLYVWEVERRVLAREPSRPS